MTKYCLKINCPSRFNTGDNSCGDSIPTICPQCESLYYVSETAQKKFKKITRILLGIVLFFFAGLFLFKYHDIPITEILNFRSTDKTENEKTSITPENIISQFFNLINKGDFEEAYALTDNEIWSFNDFGTTTVWGGFSDLEVLKIKKKYYNSRYGGDLIFNVIYNATNIATSKSVVRDHDFHIQKQGNKWKIIRMIEPRLETIDRPNNAMDCVEKFLNFLNDGEYLKAYLLTDNPRWKPKSHFISHEGWGCINMIEIREIYRKHYDSKYGSKVYYAKYYAQDPCNKSEELEFDFHLDNKSDYWKIVRATIPK